MGLFAKHKKKKKTKQFAKSMDLEVPVENTGNWFYANWGIISIAASVLASIPLVLMFTGVISTINFGLISALIIVVPGTVAILGYILYRKDKKKQRRGFK